MKRLLLFLLALCAIAISRADITFSWDQTTDDSKVYGHKYEYIYLYKNGVRLSSTIVYPYNSNSITIPSEPGQYSYSTSMGHIGNCTDKDRIALSVRRLKIRLETRKGLPIQNENISIYRNGSKIESAYTNDNGEVRFYLSPSDQYAYQTNFNEGSIPVIINKDVEVVITAAAIQAIAKYGNFPIPDKFTLLSNTGILSTDYGKSSSSSNVFISFTVNSSNKDYYLENELGIACGPFRADSDINYLEYRKVTFISEGKDAVPLLKSLNITGKNTSKSKSVITDGKGKALVYLLPGHYHWHHLLGNGAFEVGNKDQIIHLASERARIKFVNNGNGIADINYTITSGNGADIQGTTDHNGYIELDVITSESTISVNGLGEYSVENFYNAQDIPVHKLRVTGDAGLTSYTLTDTKNNRVKFPYSTDVYVLPGKYRISRNEDYTNNGNEIIINGDTTYRIDLKKTITIKVIDTRGNAVPFYSLWCIQNGAIVLANIFTNSNGIAHVTLPTGNYVFKDPNGGILNESVELYSDMNLDCIVPEEIKFEIYHNGVPYDGKVTWQPLGGVASYLDATSGNVSGRIGTELPGLLSIQGYNSADMPVIIKRNSKFNFVPATISCKGKGIVVPGFSEYAESKLIEGQTIRLKAIPTQYGSFKYWTINGVKYEEDVIDFTIGSDGVNAIATFDESITSTPTMLAPTVKWHITPNPVETIINFPEEINAPVTIFSSSGQEIQTTRVIGSSMDVSNLLSGVYILVVMASDSNPLIRKAKFIKK